ncbi:hypothetical protein M9980_10075 [Sphingomonas donggukensis]|uniref:HTH araC/xylS-type domain-containing protein n=1 Tax=Sphingomonas donggukensis TaxID=2949093 RepID=A0ABY4TR95_9SPHN|nr:hypothetical protein [Sphingomonas donggukensis]URW74910.1 hypothetical protein M9980_10075 [Sphingomonas donggukensis]
MIESGSNTPGVSADTFGLPDGTAIRYERPARALAPYFTSYVVLDSDPAMWGGKGEWMLPSWAQIWIVLTDGPITVRIGNRTYAPLPRASLYGVTSRAMPVIANGGATVGIDISPLGWARLFRQPADLFGDRVVPLETMLPRAWVDTLVERLRASNLGSDVQGILDEFLTGILPPENPDEPMVAQIMALLADREIADPAAMAKLLGIDQARLRRMTKRYFGFPPKVLKMRSRFLQAFVPMLLRGRDNDFGAVPPRYHDVSHFIRDGRRYLTMTPRRFAIMDTPYLDAALRARGAVFGAKTPTLEAPAAPAVTSVAAG